MWAHPDFAPSDPTVRTLTQEAITASGGAGFDPAYARMEASLEPTGLPHRLSGDRCGSLLKIDRGRSGVQMASPEEARHLVCERVRWRLVGSACQLGRLRLERVPESSIRRSRRHR